MNFLSCYVIHQFQNTSCSLLTWLQDAIDKLLAGDSSVAITIFAPEEVHEEGFVVVNPLKIANAPLFEIEVLHALHLRLWNDLVRREENETGDSNYIDIRSYNGNLMTIEKYEKIKSNIFQFQKLNEAGVIECFSVLNRDICFDVFDALNWKLYQDN